MKYIRNKVVNNKNLKISNCLVFISERDNNYYFKSYFHKPAGIYFNCKNLLAEMSC